MPDKELVKNLQQEQQQGFSIKKEDVLEQLQSVSVWDQRADLQSEKEKQDYKTQQMQDLYRRIKNTSEDRNRVFELRNKTQQDWEIDTSAGFLPKRVLAVARKDKQVAKREKSQLKNFQKSRKDADYCTIRVFNSMRDYFDKGGYQNRSLSANNEEGDPTLIAFTQRILYASFDPRMLTEEYFSEHAAELYEMVRDLKDYTRLRDEYPVFFDSLPLEQIMQLEARANWAAEFEAAYNAIMRVHGLELQLSENGTQQIALTSITNKRLLKQEQRDAKAKYEEAMNNLGQKVSGEEITLARNYANRYNLDAESITKSLIGEIANHTREYESWGYGIQEACKEYRKALEVRDRLLKREERFLNDYDTKDEAEKKRISGRISKANKMIGLISAHADCYKDIIYYLSGLTVNISEGAEDFLRREKKTGLLEIVSAKMMIEGTTAEKEYRDLEGKKLPEKEIARRKAEGVSDRINAKGDGFQDFVHTRQVLRDYIRDQRKDFTKAYLKLTKAEKKTLREKKVYVHEKKTLESVKKYTALGLSHSNGMKSVGEAMRKFMPEAYNNIDKIMTSEDEAERSKDLIHAMGTRLLKEGHDVIEFDVGGSSFREFSHNQNGFFGYGEQDEAIMQKQYGRKYNETHPGEPNYIREKVTSGKGKYADRKKYRYTIAGPTPDHGGLLNVGPYAIDKTMNRICNITAERLIPIFKAWKIEDGDFKPAPGQEHPDHHTIDLMIRGHSRGGVGASLGAMRVKYWLHTNYPEYEKFVKFHLIQYDPVPGKGSCYGGFDKIEHNSEIRHVTNEYGMDLLPLGESADTTVIYSMNTQYPKYFTPQEVRDAKRVILTPFNHSVGLAPEQMDTSQMQEDSEKVHAMPFIDARDGKVYRQSGLNELQEGLYILDEQNIIVKIDRIEDFIRIMQATAPRSEQLERQLVLLKVVASKLNVPEEQANYLWSKMLAESEDVKQDEPHNDIGAALEERYREPGSVKTGIKIADCEKKDGLYIKEGSKVTSFFGTKPEVMPAEAKSAVAASRMMKFMGFEHLALKAREAVATDKAAKRYFGVQSPVAYDPMHDLAPATLQANIEEDAANNINHRVEYTPEAICQMSALRLIFTLFGDVNAAAVNDLRLVVSTREEGNEKVSYVSGAYMTTFKSAFDEELDGNALTKSNYLLAAFDIEKMAVIDKDAAEAILKMNADDMKLITSDLLSEKQQQAFASRLEYMQKILWKAMEDDLKKPEKERRFVSKNEIDKKGFRKTLQDRMRKDKDGIFEEIFEENVTIENAEPRKLNESEKNYEKIYQNLRSRIKNAPDAAAAVRELTEFAFAMDNKGFAEPGTVEQDRIVDIHERIISELISVPMLKAFLVQKQDIARRQVEAVDQKLAGGLTVPAEFRNEAEIKSEINLRYKAAMEKAAEEGNIADKDVEYQKAVQKVEKKVKEQYALYLISKENPDLIIEGDIINKIAFYMSPTAFTNKTMDPAFMTPVDETLQVLAAELMKDYPGGEQKYIEVADRAHDFEGDLASFSLLNREKAREAKDLYDQKAEERAKNTAVTFGGGVG